MWREPLTPLLVRKAWLTRRSSRWFHKCWFHKCWANVSFIVGSLLFGLLNARHVSQRWLQHPEHSFGKFYIIPWRKKVLDRSPLHMASFAIAFVPLRLLAGGTTCSSIGMEQVRWGDWWVLCPTIPHPLSVSG